MTTLMGESTLYSHQDEDLRKEVGKHLAALRWVGVIDIWQDRRIGPSDEFDREISNQQESADNLVLMLVSSDFLHSHYFYDIEMKRALEHHAEGSARVIPVILRPCDWKEENSTQMAQRHPHIQAFMIESLVMH